MTAAKGFVWADIASTCLDAEDREILNHPAISGLILFTKNFESTPQLQALTQSIQKINPRILLTTDHEGGRVQRFRTGFTEIPAMSHIGNLYANDALLAKQSLWHLQQTMVSELKNVGIYATLAPVLDIDYRRNQVIGERSFGANAAIITQIAHDFITHMHQLHMPVMGKHFPGHGFVTMDSHDTLPIDDRDFHTIFHADLQPFLSLATTLDAIMPAHIVYSQVDQHPPTYSQKWMEMLRNQLHFDGLIVSDDLTMQGAAIYAHHADRAHVALEAGVDVVTICNDRKGLVDVLDHVKSPKNPDLSRRLAAYGRFLKIH